MEIYGNTVTQINLEGFRVTVQLTRGKWSIMSKKSLLKRINEFRDGFNMSWVYRHSQGKGNTKATMRVAQETKACVVFATHGLAQQACRQWPGVQCLGIMQIQSLAGQMSPPSFNGPILFDNSVWPIIFGHVEGGEALLAEAAEALESIQRLRQSIDEIKTLTESDED